VIEIEAEGRSGKIDNTFENEQPPAFAVAGGPYPSEE
jgi:hypothetical protein